MKGNEPREILIDYALFTGVEKMKPGDIIYIVSRWQTNGVAEAIVSQVSDHGNIRIEGDRYTFYLRGKDFFPTEAEAINRVEELRKRAIVATEKKLGKLKQMKIKVKRVEVEA